MSAKHTPDRYGELMAEAALCKTSTKGMQYTFMKDIFKLKAERDALKVQKDELIGILEALTHYAECQVNAFSSGRPHLDMTLFPSLCAGARATLAKHKESA